MNNISLSSLQGYPIIYRCHQQLKTHCTNAEQNGFISYQWFKQLMELHDYNIYRDIYNEYHPMVEQSRHEYMELFDKYLYHIIMAENDVIQNLKVNLKQDLQPVVKLLNPCSMIYCVTVAPPDYVDCITLYEDVKSILKLSGCKEYTGVFEIGRKRENFHTHFLLEASNKNLIQNIKKKLIKLKYVHKIDFNMNPVKILQSLRYFFGETKLNKGVINEPAITYFLEKSSLKPNELFLKKRCITSKYKEKIFNINK